MSALTVPSLISVDDYLAGEADARVKHEYVSGRVYAMAGARNQHNLVCMNFYISVGSRLRGKPCQATTSDVKVRIRNSNDTRFYYPDAMVVCEPNPPGEVYHDRPVVIAEVLSASTRRIDEGEKLQAYLAIESVKTVLLIEPDRPSVTVYRRRADGTPGFDAEAYGKLQASIPLPEVDASLPLHELYERVDLGSQEG